MDRRQRSGLYERGTRAKKPVRTLFDEVRSESNIFAAWRHVKRSALTSGSADIRGKAAEFEHAHQKHLKRIITQLREDRFTFDPVEGALKDKRKRVAQGKDPRPIAIATIKSRVVQRAILQVLQPRIARNLLDPDTRYETVDDARLGRINLVNRSEFGVGGLIYPYGGVGPAIERIRAAVDTGAKYYYQSDIQSFFTQIPTADVIGYLRSETGDDKLADLFAQGLEVHLGNPEELIGYTHLFPNGGLGVAQGSSLSAFSGNVLLFEMDQHLNSLGVTSIRYIDDILMVAKDEKALNAAADYAKTTLASLGFGLYAPEDGTGKAAAGLCTDSIHFLGCTIQPNSCAPSRASVDKLKKSVVEALSSSKAAIKDAGHTGKDLNPKLSQSAVLHTLGNRIYGWQKAFTFCNQRQPFEHLDNYISKQVMDYQWFIHRQLQGSPASTQAMILGIPSTIKMFDIDKAKAAIKPTSGHR